MTEKNGYPDPNDIFPNEFGTTCFLKNVVKAPNIEIGEYTYYDDAAGPQHFEERNVLFNWPQFGDRLVIGKFCAIGSGTQFIMGAANHRLGSASTYPFAVFGGRWAKRVPPHMAQLPRRGDTVVGNDVWFGRMCTVMPGVKIGDGDGAECLFCLYGGPWYGIFLADSADRRICGRTCFYRSFGNECS